MLVTLSDQSVDMQRQQGQRQQRQQGQKQLATTVKVDNCTRPLGILLAQSIRQSAGGYVRFDREGSVITMPDTERHQAVFKSFHTLFLTNSFLMTHSVACPQHIAGLVIKGLPKLQEQLQEQLVLDYVPMFQYDNGRLYINIAVNIDVARALTARFVNGLWRTAHITADVPDGEYPTYMEIPGTLALSSIPTVCSLLAEVVGFDTNQRDLVKIFVDREDEMIEVTFLLPLDEEQLRNAKDFLVSFTQ